MGWGGMGEQAFCTVFFITWSFEGSWKEILGYLAQGLYICVYM